MQKLYLWRAMSPIFVRREADAVLFSSVRTDGINELLSEGVIYALDPLSLKLSEVGAFTFDSSYQIV